MSSGTPVLPGGNNTYVRSFGEGSDKLVVGFSRNPKDFALNRYVQIRDVTLKSGFYLRINTEEAGRIINSDLADFVWPDGADRPQGNDGTEQFAFHDYRTQRYNYAWKIGQEAIEQAAWGVVESHEAIKAQQAMTARTVRTHGVLANDANWESDHVIDVTTIVGNTGPWDASTVARADIQRSINYALDIILKSTLSVVRRKDLKLVMNPNTAREIAQCQELKDYLKGSRYSLPNFRSDDAQFDEYGLPPRLYGVETVVEDATKVTSRRGAAARAADYCMADGVVYLLARPGGLVAPPGGGPSFSTVSLFMYEDMSTESFNSEEHRRTSGNVVDDNQPVITASASGFKMTGILT